MRVIIRRIANRVCLTWSCRNRQRFRRGYLETEKIGRVVPSFLYTHVGSSSNNVNRDLNELTHPCLSSFFKMFRKLSPRRLVRVATRSILFCQFAMKLVRLRRREAPEKRRKETEVSFFVGERPRRQTPFGIEVIALPWHLVASRRSTRTKRDSQRDTSNQERIWVRRRRGGRSTVAAETRIASTISSRNARHARSLAPIRYGSTAFLNSRVRSSSRVRVPVYHGYLTYLAKRDPLRRVISTDGRVSLRRRGATGNYGGRADGSPGPCACQNQLIDRT